MAGMTEHSIYTHSRSSTSEEAALVLSVKMYLKSADIVRKNLQFDKLIEIFFFAFSNTHIHETIQ